jgi:hypothetical protein
MFQFQSTKEPKMTNFTFEKWTKNSVQSHEHITLRFVDGTILARSVESVRSVSTTWNAVGTYGSDSAGKWVRFTECSAATDLAATEIDRRDDYVVCSKYVPVVGKINVQRSYGNVTNPDTIRFKEDQLRPIGDQKGVKPVRSRDKHGKRGMGFGRGPATDVAAMRHAIETLRLKREGVL